MARPSFLLDIPLSVLPRWWLRVECCGRMVAVPLRFWAMQKPRATLGALLAALRCQACGRRLRTAALVDDPADGAAGRTGAPLGWRIEIRLPAPSAE